MNRLRAMAEATGASSSPTGPAFGEDFLSVIESADECLALLATVAVGRVAVTVGAVPAVFPVNFALLDGDVVFRTGAGTKLDAAVHNTVVAFEADHVDPVYHEGWSVLVVGPSDEITEPELRQRALRLPLRPWAEGRRDHVVRVRSQLVSGRRIEHRH